MLHLECVVEVAAVDLYKFSSPKTTSPRRHCRTRLSKSVFLLRACRTALSYPSRRCCAMYAMWTAACRSVAGVILSVGIVCLVSTTRPSSSSFGVCLRAGNRRLFNALTASSRWSGHVLGACPTRWCCVHLHLVLGRRAF